ncbi:hypothetical protein M3P36_14695 [Altererythrobacter sp. KTW20L]|uniref:hypothetical protein n=1 Tax=Altererythrobacter sp. KTW20L TaxID=2942210 RepID=UPI0020BE0707|nr:hypothetical protein [Altererythrobacter sp. KTW20L]MCL6252288.1 hypothetical protein [Altererythrobacter sp. KTW20L]
MKFSRVSLSALGVVLLSGCIPPASEAPPAPMPTPTPTPAPAPVVTQAPPVVQQTPSVLAPVQSNWIDAPQTAGDWRWRRAGNESVAEFSSPAGSVIARFACTAGREVVLAMTHGNAAASSMTVRTETVDRTLAAAPREGWLETRLAARDPLLDAMAFSRGRFALEVPGAGALYLPAYPEITRVVEDCR